MNILALWVLAGALIGMRLAGKISLSPLDTIIIISLSIVIMPLGLVLLLLTIVLEQIPIKESE